MITDTITEVMAAGCPAKDNSPGTGQGRTGRMLKRQRAILALIDEAGGEASHLCVTKWAFLLREESDSRGGSAFYQFLPYKYGPFSFCLYQEASALVRNGLLNESSENTWALTPAGRSAACQVDGSVRADISSVVLAHRKRSIDALIRYVYQNHPWYTVNSNIDKKAKRRDAGVAVYTAGYEGLHIDGFINGLMRNGIRRIVDVRNNPVSRRYGFHKTTLDRICTSVDIEYVHFPQLGIASRHRRNLDEPGARDALFDEYARTTLPEESGAIDAVAQLMKKRPSVLVCVEARSCDCHRSRLAEPVASRSCLPVRHLELAA